MSASEPENLEELSSEAGEEERPLGWTVAFDLPFMISVNDSMDDPDLRSYAEAIIAGGNPDPVPYSPRLRPGFGITLFGGLPLHLPNKDALAEPFEVPVFDGNVRIELLRRIRNIDRAAAFLGEIRPDRGNVSFSSVRATLDTVISPRFATNDYVQVVELVLDATNKFLAQYRFVAGAYWASSIQIWDGIEFVISRGYRSGRITRPTVYTSPGGPLISLGSEGLINASNEIPIRHALAEGVEPPLEEEVMAVAKEHVNRGRYRNAVVDAASAFEISVSDYLRTRLGAIGRSGPDIDATFRDREGRFKSITALLKDVLRDELGVDFVGASEYQSWDSNVAKLRNDIVHGGKHSIDAEEAGLAISTVYKAIERIKLLAE